jgi:hypothetical protein
VPNYAFWNTGIGRHHDPFFFWVKAVTVRNLRNLVEHANFDEFGWKVSDHANLDKVTCSYLQDVSHILSAEKNSGWVKLVSLLNFGIGWQLIVTMDPFCNWLVLRRNAIFPKLIKWHRCFISEKKLEKLDYTAWQDWYPRRLKGFRHFMFLINFLNQLIISWHWYLYRLWWHL